MSLERIRRLEHRHEAELARELRARLLERRRAAAARGADELAEIGEDVDRLVEREAAMLSSERRSRIARRILRETVGLGILEPLLEDSSVEELMVLGDGSVYAEVAGRIRRTDVSFETAEDVRELIDRVLAPLGRRVDELRPMVDARLPDGSRVNAVIPPISVDGPALSIRRFGVERPTAADLVEQGSVPDSALEILRSLIRERASLLITGGTGSGKTTLLNALSAFIDPGERVVTIEDAAELRLERPHVVRLESRPAGVERRGEVTIRDLVRNALRMRPDRIVIGEIRGPEALDLMLALNVGHRGALSTLHAGSPADAVERLATLALTADSGLPHESIQSQIAGGLDAVAHLERLPDGTRLLREVASVRRAHDEIEVRTEWDRKG